MKWSKYNSVMQIEDKYVLIYNSATDQFLTCPKTAWPLEAGKEKAEKIPAALSSKLKRIGALVPKDWDETKRVKEQLDEIDNDDSTLHVHINPTLNCNLKCWYCYEDHSGFTKMTPETIESILRFISRKITSPNLRVLRISFFGGEPLLHFKDVAEKIITGAHALLQDKDIELYLHFTTNGTLFNEEIIDFLNRFNVSFQITLDGYKKVHDNVRNISGKGTFDRILHNIHTLAGIGKSIVLRINYTKDKLDDIDNILKELASWNPDTLSKIHVDLQWVWQDTTTHNDKEVADKIYVLLNYGKKSGISVGSNWKIVNARRSCYADQKNHVLVNYNGDLFFCTARDFKTENRKGYISREGDLIWENDSHNSHMSVKFTNPVCRDCRVGALCGGGCRQKSMETRDSDGCPFGYTEADIDDAIIRRFEKYVILSSGGAKND